MKLTNIQAASLSYKNAVAFEADTTLLSAGELLKLRGPAIFLSRISGNGRKYIAESVHNQVRELLPRIRAKALYGETDHPPTDDLNRLAYVKLTEASHRIDDIWFVESEQTYYVQITILDTPNGRILKTLHDSGSPMYVSLRSLLDPTKNRQQNGYIDAWMLALITIDFVSRPGFADAVLKALPVSNEAMLAVCESLNILNTKRTMAKQKNNAYIVVPAIEGITGVTCVPTEQFVTTVQAFIADMLEKFSNLFDQTEFLEAYSGMFNGHLVALYEDAKIVTITDTENACTATIDIESAVDGYYSIPEEEQVIQYFETESQAIDEGTEMYRVIEHNRMYPVIATEDYVPNDGFIDAVQQTVSAIREHFPNGFTSEDIATINEQYASSNCKVALNVEDDKTELNILSADNKDASTISLTSADDKYVIETVTEYWMPGSESDDSTVTKQTDGFQPDPITPEQQYTVILEEDDLDDADAIQTYAIVGDDNDASQKSDELTSGMYSIVEDNGLSNTYAIVTDEPVTDTSSTNDDDDDDDSEEDLTNNELATEAARVFGMPNSIYDGVYAIENMPLAYKHIWQGLSSTAKAIIAKQAEKVSNDKANLKFWSTTDFMAIERLALTKQNAIEVALENAAPVNPRAEWLITPFRNIVPS